MKVLRDINYTPSVDLPEDMQLRLIFLSGCVHGLRMQAEEPLPNILLMRRLLRQLEGNLNASIPMEDSV